MNKYEAPAMCENGLTGIQMICYSTMSFSDEDADVGTRVDAKCRYDGEDENLFYLEQEGSDGLW